MRPSSLQFENTINDMFVMQMLSITSKYFTTNILPGGAPQMMVNIGESPLIIVGLLPETMAPHTVSDKLKWLSQARTDELTKLLTPEEKSFVVQFFSGEFLYTPAPYILSQHGLGKTTLLRWSLSQNDKDSLTPVLSSLLAYLSAFPALARDMQDWVSFLQERVHAK